jgi:hypothetical protein
MAAQEEQRQGVVPMRRLGRCAGFAGSGQVLAIPARLIGAPHVGQPPCADGDQPAARVAGQALGRPSGRGREQGLLYGVFGVVEVTTPAHEHAEDLRRQLTQQILDIGAGGHHSGAGASMIRRTSIRLLVGFPPGPGAADVRAAISIARSSLSTSTIQKPARNSLASG